MDFNVKRLAADAGTFLSRAVQFTEEKLGQAEKTELDAHLENLLGRAECTRQWTERILKQTEVLLQPNPNVRLEEFLYEKLEKKVPTRMNNHELLGQSMIESGNEFGPGTAYGNALIKCGETEKQIGGAEREFIQSSAINFLTPFRNFLEGDFKTILKERKLLQVKRLDLDAAKTRLKKARMTDARAVEHFHKFLSVCFSPISGLTSRRALSLNAEQELRVTQSEFDRQAEITRLLLEGVSSTHAHHLRCLNDLVEAQSTYYAQCYQYMVDLQKQLGSFPSSFSNNNQSPVSGGASISVPTIPVSGPMPSPSAGPRRLGLGRRLQRAAGHRQQPQGPRALRLRTPPPAASSPCWPTRWIVGEQAFPAWTLNWLMGERGNQRGKVPITYLELLN
ncbi:hypothetical protein CRUP_038273 [Coryphaenoides rupestris]|nr:hypothetical protein CRUP_038273 [Coryphaenoides rupestris]